MGFIAMKVIRSIKNKGVLVP